MTKKKNKKKISQDFTINDCANAPKPVKAIRKPAPVLKPTMEPSWDEIGDDVDLVPKIAEDGTRQVVSKKKKDKTASEESPGVVYPEIIFYLVSRYIKPEDVGIFAAINKSANSVTKSKAFWILQYKRYCENHPNLPDMFRAECLRAYGLRQTVIRALYHTYDKFSRRVCRKDAHPNVLVTWVCVNVWYKRGLTYWNVYFKLKKPPLFNTEPCVEKDMIEELGRVDANPEEGAQVLMVTCKGFDKIPNLQGMTLTTVKKVLSQGYRHHTLHLGFNSSCYGVKGIVPECELILDAVVKDIVCNWWHPQYPHTGTCIPRQDQPQLLLRDFFDEDDGA